MRNFSTLEEGTSVQGEELGMPLLSCSPMDEAIDLKECDSDLEPINFDPGTHVRQLEDIGLTLELRFKNGLHTSLRTCISQSKIFIGA